MILKGEIMLEKITDKIQLLPRKVGENQKSCQTCGGTGWLVNNKEGYIQQCSTCYTTGVINLCEICGRPKRGICTNRSCQEERQEEHDRRNEQTKISKAIRCDYDDVPEDQKEMMYSSSYGYNEGYFTKMEELIDYCEEEEIEIPEYVWSTSRIDLSLDAYSILEDACSDLHEEAFGSVDNIDELQKYLDAWCDRQTGCETYYENGKYAIKVDH